MSSMNLPNGQGISTFPIPFQAQTSINPYANTSQTMPGTVSNAVLKTTISSTTQDNRTKGAFAENAHIPLNTMPVNHYAPHNSSNDSSRTGSPYHQGKQLWPQGNSIQPAYQNTNSNTSDANIGTPSHLKPTFYTSPLVSNNMQSLPSGGSLAGNVVPSSGVYQHPVNSRSLNDQTSRMSTYNAVQSTSSMNANPNIKPPVQSVNGSSNIISSTVAKAPNSSISSVITQNSCENSFTLPSVSGQNAQFTNRPFVNADKVPSLYSQSRTTQNAVNIKPSYVSFPNQQEQLKHDQNQFSNTSQGHLQLTHSPAGINNMQPSNLVQLQPSIPGTNQQIRPPAIIPPLNQQHPDSHNLQPSLPVQQNQVPQAVNQLYMPKIPPPHITPVKNTGQMPVPTMNHFQTQLPPSNSSRPKYPEAQPNIQQQYINQPRSNMNVLNQQMGSMSIVQQGYNSMWGQETLDLMQCRTILPPEKVQAPVVKLQHFHEAINCSPECTMTKIPETNNLLQKSRLPLGVLIHPFRDLNHLPVIQCSTIVRCRACRTYINPFVYFVDSKKWKCNLCYRVNELPEEFQYDPVSKSYGDPSRRPEVKSATIEFIAPSEYMLRPPQPAVYLFLLDTSRLAIESHYLDIVCKEISSHLEELPGDSRTQVGIICYNSQVHFYSMAEGLTRPHEITVIDINDMFLPCPDNLLVNLNEQKALFKELLSQLPTRFSNTHDTGSALGAALQAAYKLIFATGGRITVFQTCLPNIGPGSLTSREDPNDRSSSQVSHLGPATDFYKRLALDCSGQQIAVDLFLLNSQYADLATLSGISRFSGGCMYHLPLFKADRNIQSEQLSRLLIRYLTRKIGFEAVMRVRCTRGMSIHTFHGNFFVRSTDLLSLPNVNPDAGFGMQLSIDESLQDAQTVCLQAALLYTSSKGERRIRVHTLCLPVCSNLSEIMYAADAQCIVGLLAKMAVDRSLQSSLTDARDAFINVCVDTLGAFRATQNLPSGYQSQGLCVPEGLKLLPLYIHAVMKHIAFRVGLSTRLDDRIFAMCEMKTLPLDQLIKQVYPDLYPLHYLNDTDSYDLESEVPLLPRLQLTAEKLDSNGVFLLDCGPLILIYVGSNTSPNFLHSLFGVTNICEIQDISYELPVISTKQNEAVQAFIKGLNDDKPYISILNIIRDNGPYKNLFTEKLVDDRMENSLSYYEFLQHLKSSIK